MGRPTLYPEGGSEMNVYVPTPVRDGLRAVAARQPRQSVSQLVTVILEDYLRRRGDLPVAVTAGDGKREE